LVIVISGFWEAVHAEVHGGIVMILRPSERILKNVLTSPIELVSAPNDALVVISLPNGRGWGSTE
jgi:hypothetical protein